MKWQIFGFGTSTYPKERIKSNERTGPETQIHSSTTQLHSTFWARTIPTSFTGSCHGGHKDHKGHQIHITESQERVLVGCEERCTLWFRDTKPQTGLAQNFLQTKRGSRKPPAQFHGTSTKPTARSSPLPPSTDWKQIPGEKNLKLRFYWIVSLTIFHLNTRKLSHRN